MATLNPIVVPAKVLKGGRHKVRISVAHNGETRYIVTDIIIDSTSEFKNGQIVKRPDAAAKNTKLRKLMQNYQSIIDELEYTNGLTCSELISNIKRTNELGSDITIKAAFQKFIELKDIKKGSKKVYTTGYNSLVRFTGEHIIVNQIKSLTIISYEKYLRDKKLSQTTISYRMAFIKILINFAKQYLEVRFKRDPFEGYKRPQTTIRQAWLSVDEIKAIRDIQTTKKNILKCRDIFMLSYYLGGINICDLIKINFNEQTNTIKYIRTKTERMHKLNKYVEFKIPDEAKPIINRYKKEWQSIFFKK